MNEENKKRLGWLASECGKEDSEIRRLEEELTRRKVRRDAMEKECEKIEKEN